MKVTDIMHQLECRCPALVEKLGGRLDLTEDAVFQLVKFIEAEIPEFDEEESE